MAAPVSQNDIPAAMQLYDSLGFNRIDGRSSYPVGRATNAWRRQYVERYGLAIQDLLDWNKNRNHFRSIAATFLMTDRNGETYWPSENRSISDIPECPRDQALLVDLLSQLFWRQNIMDQQQSRRLRHTGPYKGSLDSDVHSKVLPSSYNDQEQPGLAQSPLHNDRSDAPSVPKVPVLDQKWEWPQSQLGRTRGATLPAAKEVQTTEATQKNPPDVTLPEVAMKRSAGPSGDNARGLMDFAKIDGIGHPCPDGTSQKPSGLPEGHSTALPSTLHASNEQENKTKNLNAIDFERYADRLQFWRRQRDMEDEGESRSSLAVADAKRSRLSLGPRSPVTNGPSPHGLAGGSARAEKGTVSENDSSQTAIPPAQGIDGVNQGATVSKSAEIHYNIITARKPRLCNVTWTHGGLSNRTWAGLLQEVSRYVEGIYVEGITFTLQTRDATYTTYIDRQDENTFVHMRNRWMRIIREEMAEGVSSVFEVELELKHGARFGKVQPDEDFDITL